MRNIDGTLSNRRDTRKPFMDRSLDKRRRASGRSFNPSRRFATG
jgi:hypothetical protein